MRVTRGLNHKNFITQVCWVWRPGVLNCGAGGDIRRGHFICRCLRAPAGGRRALGRYGLLRYGIIRNRHPGDRGPFHFRKTVPQLLKGGPAPQRCGHFTSDESTLLLWFPKSLIRDD